MSITLSTGWWMAPAVVSILAFGRAWWAARDTRPSGDYGTIGGAMVSLFVYGAAAIVALLAWLIWALVA